MSTQYYLCGYRLSDEDGYFIWYTNDEEGVVVDENGLMQVFRSRSDAQNMAYRRQIVLIQREPTFYDLDRMVDWLASPSAETIDCSEFNNLWNLFTDVSGSTDGQFDPDRKRTERVYDKLFWGCNLPTVTPPGETYEPVWEADEVDMLVEVMQSGVQMFQQSLCLT